MIHNPDLTYLAVRRQIDGMMCSPFEVGIRDALSKKMMSRVWSRAKILAAVPWLKLQNSKGSDIYVRAAHNGGGLVLVDDVTLASIERMKAEGLAPAVVIETSPTNYQTWIRLAESLPSALATFCAKALARRYHGDPASADWRHYGRLAGFTNRKPVHTTENNNQPWVLCNEANGHIARRGAEFVEACAKRLNADQREGVAHRPLRHRNADADPRVEFTRQWAELTARYGSTLDSSRADFMICRNLMAAGFSDEDIAAAMLEASPALRERKTGHDTDYIRRTLIAARRTCLLDGKRSISKSSRILAAFKLADSCRTAPQAPGTSPGVTGTLGIPTKGR